MGNRGKEREDALLIKLQVSFAKEPYKRDDIQKSSFAAIMSGSRACFVELLRLVTIKL